MKITGKMISTACSAGMLLAAFTPAVSAASITKEQAKETAQKAAPKGSTFVSADYDNDNGQGKYEIKFYDETKKERVEIDVSEATGTVTDYDSQLVDDRGSSSATLSEEQAKAVVSTELPKAQILKAVLESDDSLKSYTVWFKTDNYYGEYEIHPQTGAVIERDIKIGAASESWINNPTLDKDSDDFSWSYTGDAAVSSGDSTAGSDSMISAERAKKTALAKAPGATLVEFKLDHDDGRAVYEGELRKDLWKYEFTIDAQTGKVLEWEADFDD